MKRLALVLTCCLASPALAQAPDMTKMGPLSRPVTKPDRKGVEKAIEDAEAAWMKGDLNAVAEMHDFPIYMGTDSTQGEYHGGEWTREMFMKMMGQFMKDMPKDMKFRHKPTIHFLSDTMAIVVDEPTAMKGGKKLGTFKSTTLLVREDDKWLFKAGFEPGWGNMPMPGQLGNGNSQGQGQGQGNRKR